MGVSVKVCERELLQYPGHGARVELRSSGRFPHSSRGTKSCTAASRLVVAMLGELNLAE